MTDLLPTGAIRLDHLVQKTQSSPDQMTASEKTHLSVAQCNGNAVLEISDFYTEKGCYTPTSDEVMRGYDPQAVFQRYRLEVIDAIVRSKITSLKSEWPEEDIQTLVKMIAQEATAVLDISKMVDELFVAMANQKYNVKGLLVFARIYITVYNFGEAHKAWVAQGKNPALPGNETEIFVTKTLERLQEGKIGIAIMSEEWSVAGAEMFYHYRNNFVFIPLDELFRDPSMISSQRGNRITAVILHELYHSHQDAAMLPLSDLDSEIEAEIFGSRVGIILYGYEGAKVSLENVIRTVRENISQTKASGDAGPIAQVTLQLGTVDTVEDHMRFGLLEVSRSELEKGETDQEGRKKFRERYTRQIAIFYLQPAFYEFNFRDVNPNENSLFRKELESRFGSKENITDKILVPKVKITTGGADVLASVENYGREGVRQLYAVYYLRGFEAAVTFFNDVFLPDYVSYCGKALEVTMREYDGLDPK